MKVEAVCAYQTNIHGVAGEVAIMAFLQCPRCGGPVHEVFFGDETRRWRCWSCNRIFAEPEWQLVGDELIRVWSP